MIPFFLWGNFHVSAKDETGDSLFEQGYVHMVKGKYNAALDNFQQFIDWEKTQSDPRLQKIAMMFQYRAYCFEQLQLVHRAIRETQKAMDMYEMLEDSSNMAMTCQKLGRLYFSEDKLEQAILFFNTAKTIFEKSRWIAQIQKTLFHLGEIEFRRGNFFKAKLHFQRCSEAGKNYGMAAEFTYLEGDVWFYLAKIALAEDSLTQAQTAIQMAEYEFRKNLPQMPQFHKPLIDLLIFEAGSDLTKNKDQAWKIIQQADHLAKTHSGFSSRFQVDMAKARHFIRYMDFPNAEYQIVQLKSEMARRLDPDLYKDQTALTMASAELYQTWYLTDKNPDRLHMAFKLLEEHTENQKNRVEEYSLLRDRAYSGKQNKQLLDHTVDLATQLFEITGNEDFLLKAFYYAERFSAAIFRENQMLANQENKDALFERKETEMAFLKLQINDAMARLNDNKQKESENSLQLVQLVNRFETLPVPWYYSEWELIARDHMTLMEKLRSALSDNEVYLRMYETEQEIFQFLVTKNDFEFRKIYKTDEFEQARANYAKFISSPGSEVGLTEIREFANASNLLYQHLVWPFSQKIGAGEVIIDWPDSENKILFETLLTSLPDKTEMQLNHLPWLIFQNNIRYSTSVSHFCKNQTEVGKKPQLTYAGFAPFTELATAGSRKLESSGKEVVALSRILHGKRFLAGKSTKEAVQDYAGKTMILHLATHAQNHDVHPQLAELSFLNKRGDAENLYLYEIQQSRWNAELVILGACGTAAGEYIPDYGTVSLANSFLSAGAQTVIGANWKASDFVSSEILANTAKNIRKGKETSEALRQAKIDFLMQSNDLFSHPFYWAVYTCHGKKQQLKIKTTLRNYPGNNWITISIVGLFLLVIFYLIQKFQGHGIIFRRFFDLGKKFTGVDKIREPDAEE